MRDYLAIAMGAPDPEDDFGYPFLDFQTQWRGQNPDYGATRALFAPLANRKFAMDAARVNSVHFNRLCTSDLNSCEMWRIAAWSHSLAQGGMKRRLRVLIVDTDRDTADSLSMLVALWGHDPLCAYDGPTALKLATAVELDVVLLDMALPRMDGCQLALQLRTGTSSYDCLLIAVTGWAREKHRRRCYQAGINLFLVKPVEPEVIELLLLLERRRLGLTPPGQTGRHRPQTPIRTDAGGIVV